MYKLMGPTRSECWYQIAERIHNVKSYTSSFQSIIIFINCNWVVTRWQWLFYMYTKNMKLVTNKLNHHPQQTT